MAKIVEGNTTGKWTAKIRCCKPVCHGQYRVEGCFTVFEIEASDLKYSPPGYDDTKGTITFKCPVCGLTNYPEWQLSNIPASVYDK